MGGGGEKTTVKKLVKGKWRKRKRCGAKRKEQEKVARIGLINVRGERGKEGEMHEVMKESEIDVCLVTETREREGVRVKGIPGFERLGKRRGIGGKKGGGIAIYIREGIMGTEINWGKDMTAEWEKSEAFNEIEWVEAVLGGEKMAVGVVYMGREGVDREWNDRIMEWLRRQIQELQRRGRRIILGGDFNGHHGLSQQGVWVPFWTPKPLKRTPQDTQIILCGISKNLNLKLIIELFHLLIIPMTLFNDIMPYFDEFIHVCG